MPKIVIKKNKSDDNSEESPPIKEKGKPKILIGFIADKVGDYYLDENKCVWNDKAELVGCHENNKIYLYTEVKKKINNIKQKISFINI